jgi:hypothetical protein
MDCFFTRPPREESFKNLVRSHRDEAPIIMISSKSETLEHSAIQSGKFRRGDAEFSGFMFSPHPPHTPTLESLDSFCEWT